MARVWREGQRKEVQIYRLVMQGTIEDAVFQVCGLIDIAIDSWVPSVMHLIVPAAAAEVYFIIGGEGGEEVKLFYN